MKGRWRNLINKIIKVYSDARLSFIHKMSGTDEGILVETDFLDDATIECKIAKVKKEFQNISKDLEMILKYDDKDDHNTQKIKTLLDRKSELSFDIAFLASNSLNSLDDCDDVLQSLDTDFKLCIEGLKHYRDKDYQRSFEAFYTYFKSKDYLLEHFLINKAYGTLLCRCKQYDMGIPLLRKAIEKRPNDIDSHRAIKEAYSINGMKIEEKIHSDILSILEA